MLVSNPANNKRAVIQVKTHFKKADWFPITAGKSDFFLFVDVDESELKHYIVPTNDVRSIAQKNYTEWMKTKPQSKTQQWLETDDVSEYNDKWKLIESFLS